MDNARSTNPVKILCILLFLAGVVWMAFPKWGNDKYQARMRNCQANMRLLSGCVEMFNMDAGRGNEMQRLDLPLLQEKGVLKFIPECSERGDYSLVNAETIRCSFHGTVEEANQQFMARINKARVVFWSKIGGLLVLFGLGIFL
jgi:hypothetical protein